MSEFSGKSPVDHNALRSGSVRIRGANGSVSGSGAVIPGELILTAKHTLPAGATHVWVSAADREELFETEVIEPHSPHDLDIAVLKFTGKSSELGAKASEFFTPLPISSAGATPPISHAFGFPSASPSLGILAQAESRTAFGQLEQASSKEVTLGFSGGPVWSNELSAVVGVVCSVNLGDQYKGPDDSFFYAPIGLFLSHYQELELSDRNPYKNLEPFGKADSNFYFGREESTKALLSRLLEADIVCLVGPSGSGKTSLLNAGITKEANAPAYGLLKRFKFEYLRFDADHPDFSVTRVPGEHKIYIVDQLERLLTAFREEQTFSALISKVLDLASGGSKLVLSFRADFYGQALSDERLAKVLQTSQIVLSPMNREQIESAIVEPARICHRTIDPKLVDAIVSEVIGRPGELPILQFTLTKLWEVDQHTGTLKLATLSSLSGSSGGKGGLLRQVVAQICEDAWLDLPGDTAEKEDLWRDFFLKLTRSVEGIDESSSITVGRRLLLSELSEAEQALTRYLADKRLVTLSHDSIGRAQVEVAHESLFESWPRLRDWILENSVFLSWRTNRLAHDLRRWKEEPDSDKRLLKGDDLTAAVKWRKSRGTVLTTEELGYIDKSLDAHRLERLTEERAGRRKNWLNFSLTALFGLLALVAYTSSRQSAATTINLRESNKLLTSTAYESKSRGLASDSNGNKHFAATLAYLAHRETPTEETTSLILNISQRWPKILYRGIFREDFSKTKYPPQIRSSKDSPIFCILNSKMLSIVSPDGTQSLQIEDNEDGYTDACLSSNGKFLAILTQSHSVRVLSTLDKKVIWETQWESGSFFLDAKSCLSDDGKVLMVKKDLDDLRLYTFKQTSSGSVERRTFPVPASTEQANLAVANLNGQLFKVIRTHSNADLVKFWTCFTLDMSRGAPTLVELAKGEERIDYGVEGRGDLGLLPDCVSRIVIVDGKPVIQRVADYKWAPIFKEFQTRLPFEVISARIRGQSIFLQSKDFTLRSYPLSADQTKLASLTPEIEILLDDKINEFREFKGGYALTMLNSRAIAFSKTPLISRIPLTGQDPVMALSPSGSQLAVLYPGKVSRVELWNVKTREKTEWKIDGLANLILLPLDNVVAVGGGEKGTLDGVRILRPGQPDYQYLPPYPKWVSNTLTQIRFPDQFPRMRSEGRQKERVHFINGESISEYPTGIIRKMVFNPSTGDLILNRRELFDFVSLNDNTTYTFVLVDCQEFNLVGSNRIACHQYPGTIFFDFSKKGREPTIRMVENLAVEETYKPEKPEFSWVSSPTGRYQSFLGQNYLGVFDVSKEFPDSEKDWWNFKPYLKAKLFYSEEKPTASAIADDRLVSCWDSGRIEVGSIGSDYTPFPPSYWTGQSTSGKPEKGHPTQVIFGKNSSDFLVRGSDAKAKFFFVDSVGVRPMFSVDGAVSQLETGSSKIAVADSKIGEIKILPWTSSSIREAILARLLRNPTPDEWKSLRVKVPYVSLGPDFPDERNEVKDENDGPRKPVVEEKWYEWTGFKFLVGVMILRFLAALFGAGKKASD